MTFNASATPSQRQKAVTGLIAQLNADHKPILCGPYRSELGFEALYWIPFLRYLATKVGDFSKRASIVTRGGLAPLYTELCHQGFDLYALRDVKEVRRENLYDQHIRQKGKTQKQLLMTDWDEAVLEDAADALSLARPYHVLHPAWMYWAHGPFWEESAGWSYLRRMADYAPLPKIGVAEGLPPSYVAVKFYARHTFPYPHPEIAEFVKHVVGTIAAQAPVVVLSGGGGYDDHRDIPVGGPNIYHLPAEGAPEENLLRQAAVLSHAKAFVGTYGGMAQLALRLGVASASFYAQFGGTAHAHLSLSSWLSKATNVPFVTGSLHDVGFWRQLVSLPAAKATPQPEAVPA